MTIFLYILLGLVAGMLSGLIGIGGGIILVPALAYLARLPQHEAQGTTLALFALPIGILGAWTYYKHGHIDFKITGLLALGFVFGSLAGSNIAVSLPEALLRRIAGGILFLVSLKMLSGK